MPNKLIDIINITKSYDENVILDQLNLYIRENEIFDTSWSQRMRKDYPAPDSRRI